MLIALCAAAAVLTHRFVQYAPTNLLMTWLRQPQHLKLGARFMLLGVAYWAAASGLALWILNGGPGWLSVLVLLSVWNGCKFLWFGPWSRVLLAVIAVRAAMDARRRDVRDSGEELGHEGATGSAVGPSADPRVKVARPVARGGPPS